MKIKNVTLALAGGSVAALGLFAMTALAQGNDPADKNVTMDPSNAVQHIVNVKLIENGSINSSVLKLAGRNLVGVETDNFILSQIGSDVINEITNSTSSDILGGSKNRIENGSGSTILGGENNINKGKYSTILGGRTNTISDGENSVIVGGIENNLNGNYSVIVGGNNSRVNGNYSAALGSNTEVNGNNSVALGNNSKNKANNSFLWTDGTRGDLNTSNVFVVDGVHGMVVNANKAHPLAQLTIGGPLVIHEGEEKVACNEINKGVVKLVEGENGYKCFCSCDGNKDKNGEFNWHSLYGQGRCEGKCNSDVEEKQPDCGTSSYKICSDSEKSYFVGSCNKYSKPVVGSGAYIVDGQGNVHWTCQTDAGLVMACSSSTIDNNLPC